MLSEGSIVAICTMVVTIATLYFQNRNNAERSKERSADLKDTIDGKVTKLIQTVEEKGELKIALAESKALAVGKEKGEEKAALTALQHDAVLAARALPCDDEKLVNGGKILEKDPDKT